MKKNLITLIIASLLYFVFFACEKEEEKSAALPIVETASVDEIYNTTARVGGRITSGGATAITERGIYWGTSANPETTGSKLQIGSGTGIFYDTLTGLTKGTKYYVKAYAINSKGTSLGDETNFTTQVNLPTVSTSAVTECTSTTARVGGAVSDDGGYEITQRGVYWGTKSNLLLNGYKLLIGSGTGEFSQTLTELDRSVTYYVMAFATNVKGTTCGEEVSFTTVPVLASVYTVTASNITTDSATIGGNIESDGGSAVTDRGFYLSTTTSPLTTGSRIQAGIGSGAFYTKLGDLNPGTSYYYIAYAINNIGTSYGEEKSFTTKGEAPAAVTFDVTDIMATSARVSAIVEAGELPTSVTFEWGTTTSYGNTITAEGSPTTQSVDTLSTSITGLQPSTAYYYRVRVENELGSAYGGDSTFTTVLTGITGTVTDVNGTEYPTIGIGKLYWMTENLRATKYNNGTDIQLLTDDSQWDTLGVPAYCWYNNDSTTFANPYGALYNWYAVNTNNLCPSGWRLPTEEEITELFDYLGGSSYAGGLLKESGTSHWKSPNTDASNEYDFTALPGGRRLDDGSYDFIGVEGNWWTSSEYSAKTATYFYMLYNYSNSFQSLLTKKHGLSVRCVRN